MNVTLLKIFEIISSTEYNSFAIGSILVVLTATTISLLAAALFVYNYKSFILAGLAALVGVGIYQIIDIADYGLVLPPNICVEVTMKVNPLEPPGSLKTVQENYSKALNEYNAGLAIKGMDLTDLAANMKLADFRLKQWREMKEAASLYRMTTEFFVLGYHELGNELFSEDGLYFREKVSITKQKFKRVECDSELLKKLEKTKVVLKK